MARGFRFFAGQVCCSDLSVLECVFDSRVRDLRILRSFSLPLDEIYLWNPRSPVFLSVPSNIFFLKQVHLLCPDDSICDLAARFEYDRNVPFPSHLVYWNYDFIASDPENIEKWAVILGSRMDVVERWLDKMGPPISNAVGITSNLVSFYNLLVYWDFSARIRKENKVIIGLLCDGTYTDMVILGSRSEQDWLRTFSRPYGNVSLIWDIKETLEAYFAQTSPVVGTVPLSKEIDSVYLLKSEDLPPEKEWEKIFSEQMGVEVKPMPCHEILGDQVPLEKSGKFAVAFGLAVSFLKDLVPVLDLKIEIRRRISNPVTKIHLLSQVGMILAVLGASGYGYFHFYLPLREKVKEHSRLLKEYQLLEKKVKRWSRQRDRQLERIGTVTGLVTLQYAWPEILQSLAKSALGIDGVRVDGISGKLVFDEKRFISFSVQVTAEDYDSLNDFLSSLRTGGRFDKVSPVTSQYDEETGKVKMLLVVEKWLKE